MPNTLYLLDAMALAYRAHFIFINRPLMNSKGQNTSATYGFTSALLKLIEDHQIEHIAVVFDVMGEGGTFRDEMYGEYKAHRDPPPQDLLDNLPWIKDVVLAMDIPVVEVEGVEADDVIGTLARQAEADDADVVIVSPDKDFQQLLSDRISIFRPARRGEAFDMKTADTFREAYGVEPIQFIDMLALMGDTADNVPGVPGIGEKTAAKLIQQYGSIEALLEHAPDVKGKRAREGLLNHADDARLSKKLVTILTDVPVDFDWDAFHRANPDLNAIRALFNTFEFNTLYQRVEKVVGKLPPTEGQGDLFTPTAKADEALTFDFGEYAPVRSYDADAVAYHVVRNAGELDAFVDQLAPQTRFAFDTETTSTNPMLASLVGMSFAWEAGEAWYLPTPLPDGTTTATILGKIGPLLQGKQLLGQNLKYDLNVLARPPHHLHVDATLYDTMIASYLIDAESRHNMDALAKKYLNYRPIPISDLIGTGRQQISMREVPLEKVIPYACEDADITLQLADVLAEKLDVEPELLALAHDIELPLIPVLVKMEQFGVRVDEAVLRQLSEAMQAEMDTLEQQIYDEAGETFNINSTKQLGTILFEKLELPIISKTASGKPSTKESVLQALAAEHALPDMILTWRQLTKLKSTYVDALGALVHPETGRIHTSFNQTVAATGRLSSSDPNLQNIPIRTTRGREIRKAFVPADGFQMIAADYAQIELRILASISGDETMREAFRTGRDIHTATAARVFGIAEDEVTRDQRRKAKEVNYGIPYGVSAFGLAQRLKTSVSEADELIKEYQRSFPQVSRYLNQSVENARTKGYAETLLGRRRYVPDIQARNRNVRSAAERIAVNMPIQGTQADMIKRAMIRLYREMTEANMRSRMLLQVHDELVFEAVPEEVATLSEMIRAAMIEALPLEGVPVEVDLNVGANWYEVH